MSGILDTETLRELVGKATPGPWETDTEYNESDYGSGPYRVSGFKSSMILGPDGLSLFDALNSTASVIHEDYPDEDGDVDAWDETSRANAALIVTLVNSIPEIIAMMEREEAREAELAAVKAERDRLREAITSLLALGPDHDDWCGIGPIYNCTCDLHPARQEAFQALKGTVG